MKQLRVTLSGLALMAAGLGLSVSPANAACEAATAEFGMSRIVDIDTTHGPIFGAMTNRSREPSFLKPNEVVLTFDDGPIPWITKSILDTLDKYCAKATFFSVGRMALAYPASVKDVMARGHTLGSHTYSHPFNMQRMNIDAAAAEIERGIAAVSTAAGAPVAPFFRFTGLADSNRLLGYLQTRSIAAFTVDVVSNDSYTANANKLAEHTLAEIAKTQGGIVLFHDIKAATTKALPIILSRLKASGYTVVHMTAKTTVTPMAYAMHYVAPKLTKTPQAQEMGPMPTLPETPAVTRQITEVAPDARDRTEPSGKASPHKASRKRKAHSELPHRIVEAEADLAHTAN